MSRFLSKSSLASIVIAISFLILLATRFDIDWGNTFETLKDADMVLYVLAFGSYYFGFYIRGLRWRIMLSNADVFTDPRKPLPSSFRCARYVFIGWFANAITWFRLGDAYRAYSITSDYGYSFPKTIGTVVSERILDVTMVFILLIMASVTLYKGSESNLFMLFIGMSTTLALVAILSFIGMKKFGVRIANLIPNALASPYLRFHSGTIDSLDRIPTLLILSFISWLTEIGRLYFVVQSLENTTIVFPLVVFVTLANAILTTIPLTPGGLGIVEPGIIGLLTLSIPASAAISIALLDRSISYVSIVVFGALLFVVEKISYIKNTQEI